MGKYKNVIKKKKKKKLPDRSYSISDIQDYFKCILTFNFPIRIDANQREYRITFRIQH